MAGGLQRIHQPGLYGPGVEAEPQADHQRVGHEPEQATAERRDGHIAQRPQQQREAAEQERAASAAGVGNHTGGDLEQNHAGGEGAAGDEHLEDVQAGVQQEQRVDAPDDRCGEREQPRDRQVGQFNETPPKQQGSGSYLVMDTTCAQTASARVAWR
jgi:hypothetical protein